MPPYFANSRWGLGAFFAAEQHQLARIKNPVRFSAHFGIAEGALIKAGVLNPTLNVDTRLFIDPLLIPKSKHPDIRGGARRTYVTHFSQVIRLLKATKAENDVAWRNAVSRNQMDVSRIWRSIGLRQRIRGLHH
jgi:hypothetical protein